MRVAPLRRTGLLDRRTRHRDARLFLVASEDTYAVKQYFAALESNGVLDTRRVRVVVFETADEGRSDPRAVRERLARAESSLDELLPMDERWLCLDLDHWGSGSHARNLAHVCKEAPEVGYAVAISNPAFEVWLLLHFVDEPRPTQVECEQAIRKVVGSYSKKELRPERYSRERVAQAVERARRLDVDPGQRWPQQPGSHVYRMVESLWRRS